MTWKRHLALFPSLLFPLLLPSSSLVSLTGLHHGPAQRAMHYPAITTSIYNTPSITITYSPPPAFPLPASLKWSFRKAAPLFLVEQGCPCKWLEVKGAALVTVRNEHHHFLDIDRDNVQNKSLPLPLPEAWQDPPPLCSVFLRSEREDFSEETVSHRDLQYMQPQNDILNS